MNGHVKKMLAISVIALILIALIITVFLVHDDQNGRINIDGNDRLMEEAERRGWSGNGSSTDPYVISVKMNVTGSEPCLTLNNTDLYVKVVDCSLSHQLDGQGDTLGVGILLNNATHITIVNNIISSVQVGIGLISCTDVHITNNTVEGTSSGLEMIGSDENIISWNSVGISNGLNCSLSDHNLFHNNTFSGSGSNVLRSCNDNRFENNVIMAIEGSGLIIEDSSSNHLSNNTFQGKPLGAGGTRGMIGLVLSGSSNNSFYMDHMVGGAYMSLGASIINSPDNSISHCEIDGRTGLYMAGSDGNDLNHNKFLNAVLTAFDMIDSDRNSIMGNTMVGSNYSVTGIRMIDCDSNLMSMNDLSGHSSSGYIVFLANSTKNLCFNNTFQYLGVEEHNNSLGFDDTDLNQWNDSSTGNRWSDWTVPDDNSDGFVDIPYVLDGNAGATDWRPLV